jgi:ADP-heptose:LPS heptosyltransferase
MQTILIINISNIGDIVSSFSVVYLLSSKYKIDFYTQQEYQNLFIDEKYINILATFEQKEYFAILDMTSSSKSRKLIKQLKGTKIGLYKNGLHFLKQKIYYDVLLPKHKYNHIVKDYYPFLDYFSLKQDTLQSYPILTSTAQEKNKIITIHVGARNPIRSIPLELIDEIIIFLHNNYHYLIHILGDDMKLIKQLLDKHNYIYYTKTTLYDIKQLISKSILFIGPDSGLLHIASALDIDSIAIFGPNIPSVCSPLNTKKITIIQNDLDCRPCNQNIVCPYNIKCLKDISSKVLIQAIRNKIKSKEVS